MRLAISNIAWDVAEDEAVAGLLARNAVDAIDVAPGKYFADPFAADEREMARVRAWWADRGIEITGMQALLFGSTGLSLFGERDSREAMLRHLEAICRIGGGLGARRLVFGSPKNRDRGTLMDAEALDIAVAFFRRLGAAAQSHGVVVCLEPNPPRYGANFMTTTPETARVVEAISHPAIRMQLDTGAVTVNGEDIETLLQHHAPLVGHIHASEPDLVPLGDGGTDHARAAQAVATRLPQHVVSIEMVATQAEPHVDSIARAVAVAVRHYRAPA